MRPTRCLFSSATHGGFPCNNNMYKTRNRDDEQHSRLQKFRQNTKQSIFFFWNFLWQTRSLFNCQTRSSSNLYSPKNLWKEKKLLTKSSIMSYTALYLMKEKKKTILSIIRLPIPLILPKVNYCLSHFPTKDSRVWSNKLHSIV